MRLNLFVIESPLQAISAYEARQKLCVEDESVILIRLWGGRRKENDNQIKKVVDYFKWKNVIYFNTCAKNFFGMHMKIIKNIASVSGKFKGKINSIYLGDFNSDWMHYLKCSVRPDDVFLLDDGTNTIFAYNDHISKNVYWPKKERSLARQWLHNFLYFPFYNKKHAEKRITIFSSFDLCDSDPFVIKNTYEELKKKMNEKFFMENEVYYFGAKYSESGIMSRQDELSFIARVIDYYKNIGNKFIYIPHRDEEQDKLAAIEQLGDVLIKKLSMPAELYLMTNEEVPANIGGAYTSVLLNLKVMFSSFSLLSFRIPYSIVDEKHLGPVIQVYENYSKTGIDVVDI
nr:polysialyltransferase family glycosyltransferase [uncultured Halomonas sp.]